MRRIALCMGLLVSSLTLAAQPLSPLPGDAEKEKQWLSAVQARLQSDLDRLTGTDKKYLREIYTERAEMVSRKFKEKEILSNPDATTYLNQILSRILAANPQLPARELRVMFSRAWWPNAISMGEGTILFNIGLFNRLSTEAQAAFVLSHELAHYFLDHSNRKVLKYVNTVYNDDFQKKLKSIQKSEYQQNKQILDLAKGLSFSTMRHSREFESAADSLALQYLKGTGYDLNAALSCLALLDTVDHAHYNFPLQLSQRFHFSNYPFKKSWLQAEGLRFAIDQNEKEPDEDSLKTHPDCKLRIAQLKQVVESLNKPVNRSFLMSEKTFRELQSQFDQEAILFCIEKENISLALFQALQYASAFPEQAFGHVVTGWCLNELYNRQKIHELGKVTDLPGPVNDKEYNTLLQMIQNLRLQEIAALSYHYLLQYQNNFKNNPAFQNVWSKSQEHYNK